MAEAHGYRNLEDVIRNQETLKPGDKVYANNMGKTIALFLIGKEPLEKEWKFLVRTLTAHVWI